jgi:hypothetical protein
MANASSVLHRGTNAPEDAPTLVWRSRVLTIPHVPNPGKGTPVPRPFSFEPVISLCVDGRLPWGQTATNGGTQRHDYVISTTAEVLDVDRRQVHRWIRTGFTAEQADVVAIMFGLHPCLIWPDWFAHAPSIVDGEVA